MLQQRLWLFLVRLLGLGFGQKLPNNCLLQYRQNYAHGSPYYKLLQTEVAALAQALHGAAGVKEQAAKHQLRKINRDINSLKRKLASLEKQKIELQKSI